MNKILITIVMLVLMAGIGQKVSAADDTGIDFSTYNCPTLESYKPGVARVVNGSVVCTYCSYYVQSDCMDRPADTTVVGLQFKIPTFLSLDDIQHFSVFSYIGLATSLIILGFILLYVIIIVRSGIGVTRSEGDPEALEEFKKKFMSVVISIAILVGFFLVLNLVASFLGIGNFTTWPKYLSSCKDGSYYFQKRQTTTDDSKAESLCF